MLLALPAVFLLLRAAHAQTEPHREIFIPYLPRYDTPATPVPTAAQSERVYGLLGALVQPPGRRYTTYLATADGPLYGLVGESAELEREIVALARSDNPTVKVWGELRRIPGTELSIVVSGILPTEPPALGGAASPVVVVKFGLVNVYAGPDSRAARVGAVTLNQVCDIVGRNRTMTWWEVSCSRGVRGWIDARLVTAQGNVLNVPIVDWSEPPPPTPTPRPQPAATATPTPSADRAWRAEFFANPRLAGDPVAARDVTAVDFNWGTGSPGPNVPADYFSARFQRRMLFAPGFYRITAEADDGIRVWLDNQLIIDEWRYTANAVFSVGRVLNGLHTVRVEYYEGTGEARVRVAFAASNESAVWDAVYYQGTTASGRQVLTRREPRAQNPLDYNWSYSSPAPELLGTDYWSARWTGTFYFEAGNYVFRAFADDGVRVYLDGLLVIDAWRDGYKEVSNRYLGVGEGNRTVMVEYYDRTGPALVKLWWVRESAYSGMR